MRRPTHPATVNIGVAGARFGLWTPFRLIPSELPSELLAPWASGFECSLPHARTGRRLQSNSARAAHLSPRALHRATPTWRTALGGCSPAATSSRPTTRPRRIRIPRPALNLLVYHGVLAPRARWRSQVVRYARPAPDGIALTLETTPARRPHAGLDLGGLDAPRVRSRCPGLCPMRRPAAGHRHRPEPSCRARQPRPPGVGAQPDSPAPPQPDQTAATG